MLRQWFRYKENLIELFEFRLYYPVFEFVIHADGSREKKVYDYINVVVDWRKDLCSMNVK